VYVAFSLAATFTASSDLVICLIRCQLCRVSRVLFLLTCTYLPLFQSNGLAFPGCSSIGVTLRRSQVSFCKALVHYRLIFGFDLSSEPELRRHTSASDSFCRASRVSVLSCPPWLRGCTFVLSDSYLATYI
jgi:hypothetical protein